MHSLRSPQLAATLVTLLAAPGLAQAAPGSLSCSWRSGAAAGADNPAADPGAPWSPGKRLGDAAWRALDEHMQQFHFGLWTAEELAALEATPGVALGVLMPLPDVTEPDGAQRPAWEAGVVQWPARLGPGSVFLVAVGGATPGDDWLLRPVGRADAGSGPRYEGPASAAGTGSGSGFYRVHRVATEDPTGGGSPVLRAERIPLNPLGLQTELRLNADSVELLTVDGQPASPQVLAGGSFEVRSITQERLEAPAVVHLSLHGPGADLFTLEVLPASGEPAASATRDVRVHDRVTFRIVAPPAMTADSAFLDQVLPPGRVLHLDVSAEIVSFSNDQGDDLDGGLSETGFSLAPGQAVVFPPASQAPRELMRRTAELEIWRVELPSEAPGGPPPPPPQPPGGAGSRPGR
jgi:hypothetical protein